MRKLEELIQEFCPDGVEYKKLGDLCKTIVPPKKLEKNDYLKDGNFPIIDQGQKYIIAYTNDESVTLKSDSYIIFGDHTRILKLLKLNILKVFLHRVRMESKYLNLCLRSYLVFYTLQCVLIGYQARDTNATGLK